MATIVAASGGGNWNNTGTWVGGVVPGSGDDVQLDGTSGSVTINVASACRSLDCTGYAGTLTHAAAVTLTIGDATAGLSNIALKLAAGKYTLGNSRTSAITFASTSSTQQTVTTAGNTVADMTFSGLGGSWLLQDSLTSSGIVTTTAGTFNTNNQTIAALSFYVGTGGSSARTITLGSSAISLTMAAGNGLWGGDNAAGLTLTANTAIVTFTGASGSANMGVNTQGISVVYSTAVSTATVANGGTYKDITFTNSAIKTATMMLSGNTTVTGTLTITGNSAVNRILVFSNTAGTARTYSAATVSLTNVDFQDIAAAGAAIPFTGTSLGDCGGNSNITFTVAATQTWTIGGSGNWSDVSMWTSRVPLPQDNVFISATFAGHFITMDMPRSGKSIDCSGSSGTVTLNPNTATSIFGSVNLTGITTMGASVAAWTLAGRGSYTFTSAGLSFAKAITISAPTGTYTLQDAFVTTSSLTTSAGTLNTGNQTVTVSTFSVTGTIASAAIGTSTINLTSTTSGANIFLVTNNGTLSGSTATVNIVNATSNSRNFAAATSTGLANATINYTVAGSTGPLVFVSFNHTVGTLNFSDASNARTLTLPSATTFTVTNFNVNGTAGKLMTINSSTPGSAATVSKSSGYVNCDYLSIQDSTATGGASWYAGVNSTSVSNNTGWFFQAYSPSKFMELL